MSLVPFTYQGSKLKELKRLSELIPRGSAVCEPFVGSGIVFGRLGREGSCPVNDLHHEVADVWRRARDGDREFFDQCRDLMREENRSGEYYYERREEYNELWREGVFGVRRTALFFFLINSCHGAMVRYGPNGFNTPHKIFLIQGRKYHVEERLRSLSLFARNISVVESRDAVDHIKDHHSDVDVVYCDPPYTRSPAVYIGEWSDERLLELDELLAELGRRGTASVLSNYRNEELLSRMSYDHRVDFTSTRMAGQRAVKREDVILTYGFRPNAGLNSFF